MSTGELIHLIYRDYNLELVVPPGPVRHFDDGLRKLAQVAKHEP